MSNSGECIKPGDLVRHIEFELIGIILMKGFDNWGSLNYRVHWSGGATSSEDWYSECEMEAI